MMFASIVQEVLATLVIKVIAILPTFSEHRSRAGRQ